MSFQIIKVHWSSAFDFFKPQNLKLFILATLNNFIRSLKIVSSEFPSLLFMMPLLKLLSMYLLMRTMSERDTSYLNSICGFSWSYDFVALILLSFCFLVAARPSIGLKNRRYFISFWSRVWAFALLTFVIPEPFYPFLIMTILFFLDRENGARSFLHALKNGFKAYIYFLPVTLFLSLVGAIPLYGLMYLDMMSHVNMFKFMATKSVADFLIYFVGLPTLIFIIMLLYKFLLTSACTIYYVKIKHSHHQTFYNK